MSKASGIEDLLQDSGIELSLSPREGTVRAVFRLNDIPLDLPELGVTPARFLLQVFLEVHVLARRSEELLESVRLWTTQALAGTIIRKGKDSQKLWENAEYLLYKWQKSRNPAAIKPFTDTADSLEADYKEMEEFFKKNEGISVSG